MSKYDNAVPFDTNLSAACQQVEDATEYLAREIKALNNIKRWQRRYQDHIRLIILNLFNNHCVDQMLYTSFWRDRNKYVLIKRYNSYVIKYDSMVKIIDSLSMLEYVELVKGYHYADQNRAQSSKMKATKRLIDVLTQGFEFTQAIIHRSNREELIILKDNQKNLVDYPETDITEKMRQNLAFINSLYEKHFIGLRVTDKVYAEINAYLQGKLTAKKDKNRNVVDFTKTRLKRIFNNSSFEEGGRFYGVWWESVPSKYRPYITIDDKPTIEIDFSGYHISMLYAIEGLPLPQDDPYTIDEMPRAARKALKNMLIALLNAKTYRKALGAILKENRKEGYKKYFENISVVQAINALKEKHQAISKYFHSGFGVKLQYLDSKIAERILLLLCGQDIVALSVHDSFIVQTDHKEDLIVAMNEAVSSQLGTKINHKADLTAYQSDLAILRENVLDEDLPQSPEEYEKEWVHECVGYRKRYEEWIQLRSNNQYE